MDISERIPPSVMFELLGKREDDWWVNMFRSQHLDSMDTFQSTHEDYHPEDIGLAEEKREDAQ